MVLRVRKLPHGLAPKTGPLLCVLLVRFGAVPSNPGRWRRSLLRLQNVGVTPPLRLPAVDQGGVPGRLPLIVLGDHGVSPLGSVRAGVIHHFSQASQELAVKNGLCSVPSLVLNHVFAGTVDVIVAILRDACGREEIEQAFKAFSLYQLAGLQALLMRGPRGGR